jgi:hypothetical protein
MSMNALMELDQLIRDAGLTWDFDARRNVTVCALCGAKSASGWSTCVPGWSERDCRRLCDACAKRAPFTQWLHVMFAEIVHLKGREGTRMKRELRLDSIDDTLKEASLLHKVVIKAHAVCVRAPSDMDARRAGRIDLAPLKEALVAIPYLDLILAHEHGSNHREAILAAPVCYCGHCEREISTAEIHEWIDGDQTAVCPKCGIDILLPRDCSFPVTNKAWLHRFHRYWFGRDLCGHCVGQYEMENRQAK